MEEKRKMVRREIMFYSRVFDRKTGKHLGYLGNLTVDGLMIISEEPVEPEVQFDLRIELPEDIYPKNDITLCADSLWCDADIDPKYFNVGLQIVSCEQQDLDLIEMVVKDFEVSK